MTDQELKDLVASISVSQQETSKQMREQTEATNKQMKEHSEETDRRIEASNKQMKELIKETEKQMQETDRKLQSIGIQLGNIGRNQGYVAEEFFINTLSETLQVANIQYDEININMHRKTKKAQGEFDIVLVNGKDVAIIETKYKTHPSDLEELIHIKHKNFKALYPQYNDYNHHLGLASFHIDGDIKKEALKNNVFVLQRKGDLIETTVPM